MGKWKKTSEKYVLKSPWLSVRKDGYITPEGKVIDDFYIVDRSDFVVIVPKTEEGKFILARQYRHGVESMLANFPMGVIAEGEKPEETAKRELLEETGLSGGHIAPLGSFLVTPSFMKIRGYAFMATNLKESEKVKSVKDVEEIEEIISISEDEIEGLIEKGELCDLSSICAYFLMKRRVA